MEYVNTEVEKVCNTTPCANGPPDIDLDDDDEEEDDSNDTLPEVSASNPDNSTKSNTSVVVPAVVVGFVLIVGGVWYQKNSTDAMEMKMLMASMASSKRFSSSSPMGGSGSKRFSFPMGYYPESR